MRFSLLSVATLLGASGALVEAQCPDYTTFSQVRFVLYKDFRRIELCVSQSPQGNVSTGSLKLPFMRPAPACRTFNSSSVEVRSIREPPVCYIKVLNERIIVRKS